MFRGPKAGTVLATLSPGTYRLAGFRTEGAPTGLQTAGFRSSDDCVGQGRTLAGRVSMSGGVTRVVRALAFLLLAVAPAQAQISQIVVDDLRQIEGTGGAYKVFVKVHAVPAPTTAD